MFYFQLPNKPLGTHGRNTYFKEFSLVLSPSESKTYRLGEFYIVRNSDECIVSIAELQLIWINEKDDKPYTSAKLYFNPREVRDFLKREAENYGEVKNFDFPNLKNYPLVNLFGEIKKF